MSNPKRVVDIPGYYYDTISRRYYRQDPVNPKPQIVTREQTEIPESVINPQKRVINLLKRREIGFGKYSFFENEIISSKSSNLYCVQTKLGVNRCQNCEDVEFLKAGEKTLYVEYSDKPRTNYYLEEKVHTFSTVGEHYSCFYASYPDSFSTVDMVESPNGGNFLLLVVSNSNSWKVLLHPKNNPSLKQRIYTSSEPIWCCTKNEFTRKVAFGEHNKIYISAISITGYRDGYKIPVKGQVRSLVFNNQGNVLYTGRHTGDIGSIDLRVNSRRVCYSELYKIGIDETSLLSDENYLICAAFDGMMFKVDLRMRRPVCQYLGHVKTPRKFYFSISEPNHLLCASGSDNVTRLWNLSSGGEPLRCIKPRIGNTPCRSWLVSDGYKFLVYYFQKGNIYVYDNV